MLEALAFAGLIAAHVLAVIAVHSMRSELRNEPQQDGFQAPRIGLPESKREQSTVTIGTSHDPTEWPIDALAKVIRP